MRSEQSGQSAFSIAKKAEVYNNVLALDGLEKDQQGVRQSARQVGNTAFFLKSGNWTQGTYKDQKLNQIVYLSKEFYDLLKKEPVVKRYMKLGPQTIFSNKGVWYQIVNKS